jgi:indolepyruvate ferredoxin oxidoreductase
MALAAVALDDKYALDSGRIYLSGVQALVRLAMMQRRRDERAGLDTAGFISGYRGSPLAGFDQALWHAREFLDKHHLRFQPGLNEDLAATAVWGSQQVGLFPGAKHAGVFAMWYGKGPGVDRSGDVFKHANAAGTAPHGGVLLLAGDDHACKSSTLPHQSEYALIDASIPVLNPAGVQDILDLGLYGWALSRYSGCWVALKSIADTMDSSASVLADPHRVEIVTPLDFELPPGGLGIRWPDPPLEQEARLRLWKLPAVHAFARANRLDRIVLDAPRARLGIMTTGKSYLDTRQALDELGITEADARRLGIRLYKVALSWPLEPEGLRRFADGLDEILIVEEKRPVIEEQAKSALYNLPADRRPIVVGKSDERGAPLLRETTELTVTEIARAIAGRLERFGAEPGIAERLAFLTAEERAASAHQPAISRTPFFCSGCPHNTSTKVPEGSRAVAGIGCHYMATWMDRSTDTFTQMGGEGAPWIGQAPFTQTPHIFANLGDGTYYHSGILAIRAAIAAKVNITYKILYNDAVAMTGGQPVDGPLSVARLTHQMAAEGVERIVVVSDEPEKYAGNAGLAAGVSVSHRDDLDPIERELRDFRGVSVLIYDQTCAAEKRRRRKRHRYPDPPKRVFINEEVCEGCGDCSKQSNCLSVVPVETEFGRKRAIDQSSCNKDFSCLKGFCPSFVTVHGGSLKKHSPAGSGAVFPVLPAPEIPALVRPYGILVTGVGGTGVVTVGALLGMAAHLEGRGASVLDMTGLAQKGGAVTSHVRLAPRPEDIHAARLSAGGADLLLGCDIAVAGGFESLSRLRKGETRAVVNRHEIVTGAFTRDPDFAFPGARLVADIRDLAGEANAEFIDATKIAERLLGDSIGANLFLLGFALQRGWVPLTLEAIERAIELNGVAVEFNQQALLWGRRAAHDRAAVERIATPRDTGSERLSESLDEVIARRAALLTRYQNAAYAERYLATVRRVSAAEQARVLGSTALTDAAARGLFKLMAYKDEYEVARLYTDGSFARRLAERFEGPVKLEFHLAPPLLAERDPASGHLKKRSYGSWMLPAFRVLAKLRFLRGSALDPFGHTAERKRERALIGEYRALIEGLLPELTATNHETAVALARLPERIRGYGHIKDASLAAARVEQAKLMAEFRSAPPPHALAAE